MRGCRALPAQCPPPSSQGPPSLPSLSNVRLPGAREKPGRPRGQWAGTPGLGRPRRATAAVAPTPGASVGRPRPLLRTGPDAGRTQVLGLPPPPPPAGTQTGPPRSAAGGRWPGLPSAPRGAARKEPPASPWAGSASAPPQSQDHVQPGLPLTRTRPGDLSHMPAGSGPEGSTKPHTRKPRTR